MVTSAGVSDRARAKLLAISLLNALTTLKIMWADSGYDGKPLAIWMKHAAGLTLQIIKRGDKAGFQVVSRRWVIERTFGWLLRYRRLVRDYERRPAHHEAMVYWATIVIMTRRLARYETGAAPVRRWGGDRYDAVNSGRIDIARLRRTVAGLPLPRAADGRLRLAVDVSNWLRPGAATSPERLFCHACGRGKGAQ